MDFSQWLKSFFVSIYKNERGLEMRKLIQQSNYEKILPLLDDYVRIENEPYMPLVIERIGDNEYSIAHYFVQNGDMMRDPEITFRIDDKNKWLDVLTYQLDSMGIY